MTWTFLHIWKLNWALSQGERLELRKILFLSGSFWVVPYVFPESSRFSSQKDVVFCLLVNLWYWESYSWIVLVPNHLLPDLPLVLPPSTFPPLDLTNFKDSYRKVIFLILFHAFQNGVNSAYVRLWKLLMWYQQWQFEFHWYQTNKTSERQIFKTALKRKAFPDTENEVFKETRQS